MNFVNLWGGYFNALPGDLCQLWCQLDDSLLDVILAVLRGEVVPVDQVAHHAGYNLMTVGAERPFHVAEVVDARNGGI